MSDRTREIKFRVFDTKLNQFVVKGIHLFGEFTMFGMIDSYINKYPADAKSSLERLADMEVTQFTGYKDKDNNDIYEGDQLDIEVNEFSFIRVVSFEKGQFLLGDEPLSYYLEKYKSTLVASEYREGEF